MGIFSAVVTAVATKVHQVSNDSFVKQMARDFFEQFKAESHEKKPALAAARRTESVLLGQQADIYAQARSDRRKEVRMQDIACAIIETVKEIKLKELEADNCINPGDLGSIKLKVASLRMRARTLLMPIRANHGSAGLDSRAFDELEDKLIAEAVKGVPQADAVGRMRFSQAAVCAVAELRLQR